MTGKAYSYLRFSRPEQMRGDSFRRQVDGAKKWAAERGLVIDETLTDFGVSAFRGKNRLEGNLGQFLRLVEAGRIARGSYLIVESLDRLSRENVLDVLPLFLNLIKAGVTIVTLTDGHEYSAEKVRKDSLQLIMSLVVMARAHEESSTKSNRISKAWEQKRASASTRVVSARVPAWLKVVDHGGIRRIEFHEERHQIVRRIFIETMVGYGRRRIAHGLNKDNVPAFGDRNRGWHPSYIKKVIESRAAVGEYQPTVLRDGMRVPAGEPIPGYYPAVVTEAEFARANAAKARRNGSAQGRPGRTLSSMLRGMAYCAACGSRMTRLNKGVPPKGAAYLVCSNASRSAGCTNERRWRLDSVERHVLRATASSDLKRLLNDPARNMAEGRTAADIEAEIQMVKLRRSRLLDLVEEGDEDAQARARAGLETIKKLKAELAQVTAAEQLAQAEPTWAERQARIQELLSTLEQAAGDQLADLRLRIAEELRATYARIGFSSRQIAVTKRSPASARLVPKPFKISPIVIFDDDPVYLREQEALAANPDPDGM